jgi:hypothetical protein
MKHKNTSKVTNVGKGGKSEILPSRYARDTITGADPVSRSMGNYAKDSPYKAMADEMSIADKPMMRKYP